MLDTFAGILPNCFPLAIITIGLVANVVLLRGRAKKRIQQDPELGKGYQWLFWGYLVVLGLPLLVVAAGTLIGGVPTVGHFLDLPGGNPFVIALWTLCGALTVLGFLWIWFLGGAEFLLKYYYPLFKQASFITTPLALKIVYTFLLLVMIVLLTAWWSGVIPLPIESQYLNFAN